MTRKQESITLSITTEQRTELEKIALNLGFTWGDKPNISGLVKAIATHQLTVSEKSHSQEMAEAIAHLQETIDRLKTLK